MNRRVRSSSTECGYGYPGDSSASPALRAGLKRVWVLVANQGVVVSSGWLAVVAWPYGSCAYTNSRYLPGRAGSWISARRPPFVLDSTVSGRAWTSGTQSPPTPGLFRDVRPAFPRDAQRIILRVGHRKAGGDPLTGLKHPRRFRRAAIGDRMAPAENRRSGLCRSIPAALPESWCVPSPASPRAWQPIAQVRHNERCRRRCCQ